jgi:hypothetical protein
MTMIVDPTDPEKAIAPSGELATPLYLADEHSLTGWTLVGFGDPETMFDADHPPTEEEPE